MRKRLLALILCLIMAVSVLSVSALADETGGITVTKTGIKADGVFNSGGYGSLSTNASYHIEDDELVIVYPKAALVNRNGAFVFPYKETYNRYYCSDGIVSLVYGDPYTRQSIYDSAKGAFVSDEVGFWNLDGTTAFSGSFYGASPMLGGYAFVTETDIKYDGDHFPTVFPETAACHLIDRNGTKVYSFTTEIEWGNNISFAVKDAGGWYRDGLLPCRRDKVPEYSTFGVIAESIFYRDVTGQTVLTLSPASYSEAGPFSEGFARVTSHDDRKMGFVDRTGREVIPCRYDDAGDFNDGLAFAAVNWKYGYINEKNETVIPFVYDDAHGAANGLAAVSRNGKYGLVDYSNKVIVPLEYDEISTYEGGVAYAIKDGELYIITGYGAPRTQGDVDGDGKVGNSDLIMVARYVVAIFTEGTKADIERYGDMNGDGVITNQDIITLARKIVGL